MNALESNQQYGPRQPRYQDVTDNQKTVSSRNLRCGQWCCAQVLCFRSRRRYPLSNCSGASERFPRLLNTQCWNQERQGKTIAALRKKQSSQFNLLESLCYLCLLEPGHVMGWDMMPVANKSKHNTQHTQREVGLGWERVLQLNRVGQLQ